MSKIMKLIIGFAVVAVALALAVDSPLFAKASNRLDAGSLAKPSEKMYDQFDGNTIACWIENVGNIVSSNVTRPTASCWWTIM